MTNREALKTLKTILAELDNLSGDARDIMKAHFPETFEVADQYKALTFGRSWNKYDTTLATLIKDAEEELEEAEFLEGFLDEQDMLNAELLAGT
jgi:hypothetical protein